MNWMALLPVMLIAVSALVLMALEALLPTCGLLGIASVGLIALSAWLCYRTWGLMSAVAVAILCVLASFCIVRWIFLSLREGRLSRSGLFMREEDQQPIIHTPSNSLSVGLTGRTCSALHPTGIAQIAGERVHVATEGDFIASNVPIRVMRIEGSRILVAPLPLPNDVPAESDISANMDK